MIVPIGCISGADVLNGFGNVIPVLIWRSSISFVKFVILVLDRYSMFELFYVIYIFVSFNHLSMVINRPLNGLGWHFPAIANLEIIWCEPLLY